MEDLDKEEIEATRVLNGLTAGDKVYTEKEVEDLKILLGVENRKIIAFYEDKLFEIQKNSIPKSKIEEIIKRYEEKIKDNVLMSDIDYMIFDLKELLKESE